MSETQNSDGSETEISNTNSHSISNVTSIENDDASNSHKNEQTAIPPPPSKPAPIPKSQSIIPLRWRPDTNLRSNNAVTRIRRGKRQVMSTRASRMSETAKRMLGLMSVMMAGRAQGVTTGIYSKQTMDIQTGLDGNIC